jgi:hypothetical protein
MNFAGQSPAAVAYDDQLPEERLALQRAAERMEEEYERNAWGRMNDAARMARRWAVRLAGRGERVEEPVLSPVEAYVEERGLANVPPELSTQRLAQDMTTARELAGEVETAARGLVRGGAQFTRTSLTEDLARVERAITLTRGAMDVFDGAYDTLDDRLEADHRLLVSAEFEQLETISLSLSDRADEIAAMRRAARNGVYG